VPLMGYSRYQSMLARWWTSESVESEEGRGCLPWKIWLFPTGPKVSACAYSRAIIDATQAGQGVRPCWVAERCRQSDGQWKSLRDPGSIQWFAFDVKLVL
jgi:hypothetical protein